MNVIVELSLKLCARALGSVGNDVGRQLLAYEYSLGAVTSFSMAK